MKHSKKPQPLESLSIKSPCRVGFDKMEGDDRVRFCGDCKLNVYNLSGMTRMEAEELVATREGRLCVTFIRRFDGTIITKDCQTIVGRVKDSFRFVATFIAAIMSGASLLTACSQPVTPTTGQMCERDPLTRSVEPKNDGVEKLKQTEKPEQKREKTEKP